MPFHSTHATSHALQPMHVVTSTYLQTSSSRCTPTPGTAPEWPDICLICSNPVGTSGLLNLHEESFELGRERVRIDHRRRQQVRRRQRRASRVFRDAAIAPVDRDADLI